MKTPSHMVGRAFGKLTVMEFAHYHRQHSGRSVSYWKCRCVCGGERVVSRANLTRGHTVSCGCVAAGQLVHGMNDTPTHNSWKAMRKRCQNPKSSSWDRYGGRGITVCERWQEFTNFLADMGERPPGTTLDRIDNDGNYEPSNCRWVSRTVQANNTRANRRIEWNGKRKTLAEWAREFNVDARQVAKSLNGRKLDDAMYRAMFCYPGVQTPARLLTHGGKTQSLKAWARELGICSKSLRQRLERWPVEIALSFPAGSKIKKEMVQ